MLPQVWPLPLSLATTRGISVDFFSSRYLDVSVPGVPRVRLWIYLTLHGSSPCVFPHSEICGYNAHLQLPAAYRSLSRPSSAPDAKAFTLRSYSLELLSLSRYSVLLNCLSFSKHLGFFFFRISHKKVFLLCACAFHLAVNCSFYPNRKDQSFLDLASRSSLLNLKLIS